MYLVKLAELRVLAYVIEMERGILASVERKRRRSAGVVRVGGGWGCICTLYVPWGGCHGVCDCQEICDDPFLHQKDKILQPESRAVICELPD